MIPRCHRRTIRCRRAISSRSLADLAVIPTVAGVAAGPEKPDGVLGALHTTVLDVLVCDSSLARALLSRAAR